MALSRAARRGRGISRPGGVKEKEKDRADRAPNIIQRAVQKVDKFLGIRQGPQTEEQKLASQRRIAGSGLLGFLPALVSKFEESQAKASTKLAAPTTAASSTPTSRPSLSVPLGGRGGQGRVPVVLPQLKESFRVASATVSGIEPLTPEQRKARARRASLGLR